MEAKGKPRLVILATGGTIAGSSASATDVGYKAGALAVDTLIEAVPKMRELADVRGEQIASIGSQDMNDEVWVRLAARTNELLAARDVDGVVVTHGTDTLEETSYFLNLVVQQRQARRHDGLDATGDRDERRRSTQHVQRRRRRRR